MWQKQFGVVLVMLGLFLLSLDRGVFAANNGFWGEPTAKSQVVENPSNLDEKVKSFLPGCLELGHEFIGGKLVLTPVKTEEYDQTLFFIHNTYADNIRLEYQRTEKTPLNPLWQAKMHYNRWAVFATDQQGLVFSCYTDYGHSDVTRIDCQSAVEVCQYPRAKFGQNNQGNYWVVNNQSKIGARNAVIRQGILLRR